MSTGQSITPQQPRTTNDSWVPLQGHEVNALLAHLNLDPVSRERLAEEATRILARCVTPRGSDAASTGLVLGYVQSGKTMSFTTVTALARDNNYPMVIVVTGVSNPLLDQSTTRLERDLRLQDNRKWRLFRNPKLDDREAIAHVLSDWRDERVPEGRRKTVLVTVLKNTTNLRNLNNVLGELDLNDLAVLVVDDEADQAGLNTAVSRGAESTTYQRLVTLRQRLPRHAYLQYTATPQAPLLINILDVLSPRFVELLTPGDDYTGGEVFFGQRPELVRVIPQSEIATRDSALHEVPDSLLEALRLFFLGVAAGIVTGDYERPGQRNRSMLVHPSRETTGHGQFYHWIRLIREDWLDLLQNASDDERQRFLETFRPQYDDLGSTVPDLPPFGDLVAELEYSIRHTEILEVNARPETPQPEWRNTYPWILVGGQAMDRGYTVEGLTVTYMPRSLGVGNADTIEQRARFFGYKREYIGYCRVFLDAGVRDAFEFYVQHEDDIRKRLLEHRDSGRPLSEWRRAFFLDSSLRPTRRQVLDRRVSMVQGTVAGEWFWPRVPHGTDELVADNRRTVKEFIESHAWSASPGDARRTVDQVHLLSAGVSLREVYADVLARLRLTEEGDSQILTGILLQISNFLEGNQSALCDVYQMSGAARRVRSVNEEQKIPTLFQGANYADEGHKDEVYPGDRAIKSADRVTLQIHMLTIKEQDQGSLIADSVPAIAIWIPEALAKDWVVQQEPGS
jgi:hypothetical protein